MVNEIQNTFKFRTVIYLILGLIIPFWIITLPLFWFLAYRSYKDGIPENNTAVDKHSHFDELKKLKALLDDDVITPEEFDREKKKLLTSSMN